MMRFLVIDDDRGIVESVVLTLQVYWREVEVLFALTGEEGVKMAKEESPDVVILDLGLPDIDGFQVLEQIRSFSSVPVMLFTVRAEQENVNKGRSLGADDFIAKPFEPRDLVAHLKSLMPIK